MKKPSVTELISLLDKPALLNWANKQGLQGIDISEKRKEWLKNGTSIHNQIEMYVKTKYPFENIETQNNFNAFIENKEILSVENNIETDYFIGKYDMKVKVNDKIILIDFKNNQKNIYLENKLQLIAYSMAEKCDFLCIVGVPEFNVIWFNPKDRKPYEEILKSLSNIYNLKKQIENGSNY